ncbi:MAG: restriction endonuclease [Leptospiraceae bacterium]|nr:restriction endonuclease [Leptospiraceae bacterium]
MKNIKEEEIQKEIENYSFKPEYYRQNSEYPLNDLSDRQFETLVYNIFKKDIADKLYTNFDTLTLLTGNSDRGRDIVLYRDNKVSGIIQCKKYQKRFTKPELIREIIKFVLNFILDKTLIDDINNFDYFIVVSDELTEEALNFIYSDNSNKHQMKNLDIYIDEVLENYKSLKELKKEKEIYDAASKVITSLKYKKLDKFDISKKLNYYPDIAKYYFELHKIIDKKAFEEIIIENFGDLSDKDVKYLSKRITRNKDNFRIRFGFANFFGYPKNLLKEFTKDEHFLELLMTFQNTKFEIDKLVLDKIQKEVYKLINERVSHSPSISNYSKQIGAPYIICNLLIKSTNTQIPKFVKNIFRRTNSAYLNSDIYSIRKNLLESSKHYFAGDYSIYDNPPELKEFKIKVSHHIHKGFRSIEEIEKQLEKDIPILLPIYNDIIEELQILLPEDPTIVIGDLTFLEDESYLKNIFEDVN